MVRIKDIIIKILFIIFILVMYYLVPNMEFLKVDKCLDGGGMWDYNKSKCIF